MTQDVLAMILAGGSSHELPVLTTHRSKAALPFGGRYRVIDFCLSNCAHAGISEVGILAQYNPASLIAHVGDGSHWDLRRRRGGLSILQPFTARGETNWFRGTADALAQYLDFIRDAPCDHVLVLSADQVYRMDYADLIVHHARTRSEVTIAVKSAGGNLPSSVGGVTIDERARIVELVEKPAERIFDFFSLGIYVFAREVLIEMLDSLKQGQYDIVFDVLVPLVREHRVSAYIFDGYWADVGSVQRYFEASMGLLRKPPVLDLNDRLHPIYTRPAIRRPSVFGRNSHLENTLIANGCTIDGTVRQSILFPGVRVEEGAIVENSIVFDDVIVGRNASVRSAIIDQRVAIGHDSFIGFGNPTCPNSHHPDALSSGLTVIGTDTVVPSGIRIGRNCLIGSDLGPEAFPGRDIVCGETIVEDRKWQKISS